MFKLIAGVTLVATLLAPWSTATAQQIRITLQPRNVAVLPGQNAQFRVSASGVGPLAYEWRCNGAPLSGATNNILTLTNVTLTQLGCYEAAVSNSTGGSLTTTAWLLLATRWTELVFFGASEGQQMCATGPAWIDQVAQRLGVPLRNYSVAGADNGAVRAQIAAYLGNATPTTNTLFSLWVGGSEDVPQGSPERGASNRLDHVRALAAAGARSFLIPRIGQLPPFFLAQHASNEMVLRYDALLDLGLERLKAQYSLTVFRPDIFALSTSVLENPEAYGFPRSTRFGDLFCDGVHMIFALHQLVARECQRSMTPPLFITLRSNEMSGSLELRWQGGSPPFRLQHCHDLGGSLWQWEDITYETNATLSLQAPHRFFRVVHLGQ